MKLIKILIILLTALSITGCTDKSIDGKYEYTENPNVYVQLYEDGRYVVNQDTMFSGDYIVTDDYVILNHIFGSIKLIREGSKLIDGDGWTFEKV